MRITDKYKPKTVSDLIGETDKFIEAREFVKSKYPVLLCGEPGIGKTSAAYAIANDLGLEVSETNMSDARTKEDLSRTLSSLISETFVPTLFLLDEVDGVSNQEAIVNIVKKAKNPLILTANEKMKISVNLKKSCKFIEIYQPSVENIVDLIKRIGELEGIKPSFKNINRDVRASINAAFDKSLNYEAESNEFELTNNAFKEGVVSDIDPVWLLDNVHEFYHGIDVYITMQKIRYMIETGDPVYISTFKHSKRGKSSYPNFLRRL